MATTFSILILAAVAFVVLLDLNGVAFTTGSFWAQENLESTPWWRKYEERLHALKRRVLAVHALLRRGAADAYNQLEHRYRRAAVQTYVDAQRYWLRRSARSARAAERSAAAREHERAWREAMGAISVLQRIGPCAEPALGQEEQQIKRSLLRTVRALRVELDYLEEILRDDRASAEARERSAPGPEDHAG